MQGTGTRLTRRDKSGFSTVGGFDQVGLDGHFVCSRNWGDDGPVCEKAGRYGREGDSRFAQRHRPKHHVPVSLSTRGAADHVRDLDGGAATPCRLRMLRDRVVYYKSHLSRIVDGLLSRKDRFSKIENAAVGTLPLFFEQVIPQHF